MLSRRGEKTVVPPTGKEKEKEREIKIKEDGGFDRIAFILSIRETRTDLYLPYRRGYRRRDRARSIRDPQTHRRSLDSRGSGSSIAPIATDNVRTLENGAGITLWVLHYAIEREKKEKKLRIESLSHRCRTFSSPDV